MIRKDNKPHYHKPVSSEATSTEQTEVVIIEVFDPLEDTIEVGEVFVIDAPIYPVPLGEKAQDLAQSVSDKASTARAAAGDALDAVKSAIPAAKGVLGSAASRIGTASATGVQSAGAALWLFFQRNPLQAILVISSLIWLFRSSKAAANQPPVSLTDAAGDAAKKVGTVADHVQVAAVNLGSQVSDQASRSAGWFSKTLYENPLAVGAMAIVFGAGLGFSVPESGYENKLLGKTRDDLADKVQAAAQDLTQKVTTVAQTAAHDAVESAKAEARNQGLTVGAIAAEQPRTQDQS